MRLKPTAVVFQQESSGCVLFLAVQLKVRIEGRAYLSTLLSRPRLLNGS